MLGLDPEGPLPLEVIGDMPVDLAVQHWEAHGFSLPVSGDPFFVRNGR